ncbi:hypothetical protein HY68_12560 [Streptomyces sp. AcH 505]|uniref:DUF6907 domain-containing protein n=1 Tax=Streptomyces sp. AcH 505 TaxID=352211 RepID=UPI0005922A4A|nr:hypothetical protein HY68_12560 [Streptomyces sp. AcH 505]
MTAPRTVTVQTLDHGLITIPEPSWCVGHGVEPPQLRVDTGHSGPEHDAEWNGYHFAWAALSQDPFRIKGSQGVGVVVELGGLQNRLEPNELHQVASVLVDYASTLRHLARELTVLRARNAAGGAQ